MELWPLTAVVTGVLMSFLFSPIPQDPMFPSFQHLYNIIDTSYFFERMNTSDLYARKALTKDHYRHIYKQGLSSFTPIEKAKLKQITQKADQLMKPLSKMNAIPWRFAKVHKSIENGFPHTLGDTIILAEIPSVQTLIHEKIHVFQRFYPLETSKIISKIIQLEPKDKIEHYSLARNNPDINSFVYGRDNYVIIQTYKSAKPDDLADSAPMKHYDNGSIKSVSINEKEHPYETMAYQFTEKIMTRDYTFVQNNGTTLHLAELC